MTIVRNWWTKFLAPDDGFIGAICADSDVDPEWWTATSEDLEPMVFRANRRRALEMCAICPCRKPCVRYALKHPELHGIWGGTDEAQRKELRHRFSERGTSLAV